VAEKFVPALKCLVAAAAIDSENSKVHEQIVRFKQAIDGEIEIINPISAGVIKSKFTLMPPSISLMQYNDEYLAKNTDYARRTISGLRVRRQLSPETASTCEKDVASVVKLPRIALEEAVEALALLKSWKSGEIESFLSDAAAKWPNATVFAV